MSEERRLTVNGTDIYYLTDGALHTFCIGAYLLAGSMFESERDSGISHLYEHMVFRNLKRMYGGGLYRLLSEYGLRLDASTYKEFMCFTIHGATDGIDLAIDIISKLFLPLDIDPVEYEAEKQRIYAEMNEDDEKNTLGWLHGRCCWGDAFPASGISGRRSNLNRIGEAKLDLFRRELLSVGGLFFYVTGCVDAGHEAKLADAVKSIPMPPKGVRRENIVSVGQGFKFGSPAIKIKDSDWCHVMMSFGIDCVKVPMNIRELLYSALFELEDCAFYMELSENDPTAYSFDGTLEQYDNLGCITLSYETLEENLERSLEAAVRAITKIKNGWFSLELNKRKLAFAYELKLDRPDDLNWELAYYGHILESGKADWSKPALGRYEALTMEEVVAAAKCIFRRENLVVSLRGDRKRIDKSKIEAIFAKLD